MTNRPIAEDERDLVIAVLAASGSTTPVPPIGTLVRPLQDGGMGSLSFDLVGDRAFGALEGDQEFTDADGVAVVASVYSDREGDLLELDLFKVDFSPVRRLP